MEKSLKHTEKIVTRLNKELKRKFEAYCAWKGIGASEAVRCWILNLPDPPNSAGGNTTSAAAAARDGEEETR